MDASEIVVANLATNEPPEPKAEESPFYEPEVSSPSPDAKVPAVEPEPEPTPEPKPNDTPAAPKHTPDSIRQASTLGIPAADVEDMTPKELERTIRNMNSIAQAAFDAGKKQVTAPEVKAPVKDEAYDLDKNEQGYTPEIIATMRDTREARKEAAELRAKLAAMEAEAQDARRERVHARLDGIAKEIGASEVLDRSTAKGDENFKTMLFNMKALQDAGKAQGKDYSEKQLMEMSIRAMGLAAGGAADKGAKQDAAIEAALEAKKAEFDEGALAKPESRKKAKTIYEVVREKAQKIGLPVSENSNGGREVDWLP